MACLLIPNPLHPRVPLTKKKNIKAEDYKEFFVLEMRKRKLLKGKEKWKIVVNDMTSLLPPLIHPSHSYKRASRKNPPRTLACCTHVSIRVKPSEGRAGNGTNLVIMHHGKVISWHMSKRHLVHIKILIPPVGSEVCPVIQQE